MSLLVGIDPGDSTGLAVWDTCSQTFRLVATMPLWRALEEVKRWHYACHLLPHKVDFCVFYEDARQRTWFTPERSRSEYRGKLMGAGAAKRDAKIWEEFLSAHHIRSVAVKPRAGMTKWDAATFARVTGYQGRTSNHARDAALLVYGR